MNKGFTLVEVLLGAVIVAIIGLSVSNVFWSGIKLDDRLRASHESIMEMLMADQMLGKDLENAVAINLTSSYPDAVSFKGAADELAFLTVTPRGIRRVTYASGLVDFGTVTKVIIGRASTRAAGGTFSQELSPVEFLLRTEQALPDWVNGVKPGQPQIVAAGLKRGSFACTYAAPHKDLAAQGPSVLNYKNEWTAAGIPRAVSCRYEAYDATQPSRAYVYQRNFFLSPVVKHEDKS